METKEQTIDVPVTIKVPDNSPLQRLVNPHPTPSRQVTEADVDRVTEEAKVLYAICFETQGLYTGAYAMHHSQIEDKDPLDFFVTKDKEIIINPIITRHSNYQVDHKEGCVTFPGIPWTYVKRWQKCEGTYLTIKLDGDKFKLTEPIQKNFSGIDSFVFQHEMDHGQAVYVYRDSIPPTPKVIDPRYNNIGRNEKCPCGSEKKFKKCHLQ